MANSITSKNKCPNEGNNFIEESKMSSSQQMQVFEEELKDIYWAENAFVKALPLMIENAPSSKLIDELTSHLAETKIQVAGLENVFLSFGKKAAAKKCKAIVVLIKESEAIIKESEKSIEKNEFNSDGNKKAEDCELDPFDTLSQFLDTRVFSKVTLLLDEGNEEENPPEENSTEEAEREEPS